MRPLRVSVGGRISLLIREVVDVALAVELHKGGDRRGVDRVGVLGRRARVRTCVYDFVDGKIASVVSIIENREQ